MRKKKQPKAVPAAGRLGPVPQEILRGGTHEDARRKPRAEAKRLALREAFDFPAAGDTKSARSLRRTEVHVTRRFHRTIVAFAIAAGAVGALPGRAQTTVPAPVSIVTCSALASPRDLGAPGSTFSPAPTLISTSSMPMLSDGMSVTFVNHGSKVATLVNVVVEGAQTHFVLRDIGTFSPNVSITNVFRGDAAGGSAIPSSIPQPVRCRVGVVEFRDGSMWRYGQNVPAATGPYHLVATPDRVPLEVGSEASLVMVAAPAPAAGFKETDSCTGIADVRIGAAGEAQITYSVRPIAKGSCVARVTSENGSSLSIPIIVR